MGETKGVKVVVFTLTQLTLAVKVMAGVLPPPFGCVAEKMQLVPVCEVVDPCSLL